MRVLTEKQGYREIQKEREGGEINYTKKVWKKS